MRAGFLVDLNLCTGCDACVLACTIENQLEPGRSWRQVSTFNEGRHPAMPVYHLSLACNHCAEAPCMKSCPALAYRRDETSGTVTIDADACIGCGYCRWTCPYDAPKYDPSAGVMTKCTFCNHRPPTDHRPACVAACPTGALGHGDRSTDSVDHVPGFPRTEAAPRIAFKPLARVLASDPGKTTPGLVVRDDPAAAIRLGSEWPLAVFTLLTAALFGWVVAWSSGRISLRPIPFVALAAVGVAVSTLHLGRPLRAWRAVLNLRGSWLSREIVSFSLFVLLTVAASVPAAPPGPAGWLAALAGLLCLFSMDRVYDVVRAERSWVHSADVVLTGLLFATLPGGGHPAFHGLATAKLALYALRLLQRPGRLTWVAPVRLGVGLVGPMLILALAPAAWSPWALAGVAAGEAIDRCEFYTELRVRTTRRQIARDLKGRISRPR